MIKKIEEFCNELYVVDWERRHVSTRRMLDTYIEYYKDCKEDDVAHTVLNITGYINEYGYNGELYICFEEFLDNEYRDREYICDLLNNDKDLVEEYLRDLETLEKEE